MLSVIKISRRGLGFLVELTERNHETWQAAAGDMCESHHRELVVVAFLSRDLSAAVKKTGSNNHGQLTRAKTRFVAV